MGIFDSILEKLGFGDDEKEKAAGEVNVAKEVEQAVDAAEDTVLGEELVSEPYTGPLGDEQKEESSEVYDPGTEEAMELAVKVNVEERLDSLAAAAGEELDWRRSIVDLMKLLGLDSSYSHRKELARELGCPEELMHVRPR
jgi:hypothetical protein